MTLGKSLALSGLLSVFPTVNLTGVRTECGQGKQDSGKHLPRQQAAGSGSAQHTPQNKQINKQTERPQLPPPNLPSWCTAGTGLASFQSAEPPLSSSGDRTCLHSHCSSLLHPGAWCELISCKGPAHPLLSTCCLLHTPACCAQMYFLPLYLHLPFPGCSIWDSFFFFDPHL